MNQMMIREKRESSYVRVVVVGHKKVEFVRSNKYKEMGKKEEVGRNMGCSVCVRERVATPTCAPLLLLIRKKWSL